MQSINTSRRLASAVITLITLVVFLAGCDTGDQKVGASGIDSDQALQDELILHVDTLPPSLVLAQGAEESGWGTSRFAIEGNALFGMWTWGDEGITPQQQRSEHGDHKIASYKSPMGSVIS